MFNVFCSMIIEYLIFVAFMRRELRHFSKLWNSLPKVFPPTMGFLRGCLVWLRSVLIWEPLDGELQS